MVDSSPLSATFCDISAKSPVLLRKATVLGAAPSSHVLPRETGTWRTRNASHEGRQTLTGKRPRLSISRSGLPPDLISRCMSDGANGWVAPTPSALHCGGEGAHPRLTRCPIDSFREKAVSPTSKAVFDNRCVKRIAALRDPTRATKHHTLRPH
jgi:hypothetical protein